MKHKTKKMPET